MYCAMQIVYYPSKRSPISFMGSTESAIQQTGGGARDTRSYRRRPHTLLSPMKASVYGHSLSLCSIPLCVSSLYEFGHLKRKTQGIYLKLMSLVTVWSERWCRVRVQGQVSVLASTVLLCVVYICFHSV